MSLTFLERQIKWERSDEQIQDRSVDACLVSNLYVEI